MQRHYGIDACDVWRGTLSLRKVRVLIDQLPSDCATARAVADADDTLSGYTFDQALLAYIADEMAYLRWQWESAHLKKGETPRDAPPTVRPRKGGTSKSSDDIPLVSPHRLGGFVNEPEGGLDDRS